MRCNSPGLTSPTRYADASGADQLRLTLDALEIPAFRQILATPQVTLAVADVAYYVNASLGHDGISRCGRGRGRRAGPAGRSAPPTRATGWRADSC